MLEPVQCPLCYVYQVNLIADVNNRDYFECSVCQLVFLSPAQRPDPAAERAHYNTHENDPKDQRYRAFLNQLAAPLIDRLPAHAQGLDYGSGPGPTLSVMLREQGFDMEIYDPFFAPDITVLQQTYGFITCSETAEHFFMPAVEFGRLNQILRPGGWLGILTQMREPEHEFSAWHYIRDPTHVCFYNTDTMHWIAKHFGWILHTPQKNVVLFQKPYEV